MTDTAFSSADALELEPEQTGGFARLNGAPELQAAVLALLLPAGSQRAARAWQIATEGTRNAEGVLDQVKQLAPAARLPWLETLLGRMRLQPLAARQALMEETRRLMGARGVARPIDRLHWLAMRQWLGAARVVKAPSAASVELARLPQADVSAIASYTAFLARLVPIDANAAGATTDASAGHAWYDSVMETWQPHAVVPPCEAPHSDGLVIALQQLQGLPWMQRPLLVRGWVAAAQQHSEGGRLGDSAADALRLSCSLLDSPLPPDLARHFTEA